MTLPASARVIVALDTPQLGRAVRVARQLQGVIRYVKIGSILFTAAGPEAIRRMRALGFQVFLDLKFHDIPSTVEKSCRAVVAHRVAMLTVHASGERAMLEAAVRGVREEAARRRVVPPKVLGVTVLTSVGASASHDVRRRVAALALCAKQVGLDGVVASAQEVPMIKRRLRLPAKGSRFVIVCPGIRPVGVAASDQARVVSPAQALANGADWLVIGRPITEARRPRLAAQHLVEDLQRGRSCSHVTSC